MTLRTWTNRTLSSIALAAAALSTAAGGQDPARDRQEARARLVIVDVVAVDRDGRPVEGLGPGDLEVFEDGRPMAIRSFETVRARRSGEEGAGTAAPSAPLVRSRESRFYVLFDSVNTIRRMLDRNRGRILERILSLVRSGPEVAVFELSDAGGLKVLQSPTRDPARIAAAVDAAAGSIWVEKAADSLALPGILAGSDRSAEFERSRREAYEAETRRRFETTIEGLLAAVGAIKDEPGRKPLLLVSGGMPSLSFMRFFDGSKRREDVSVAQAQVGEAKVRDPFRAGGGRSFRSGQEILDDLVRFANSHNVTIYALDPDSYLRYALGDIAYDNFARPAYGLSGLRRGGVLRVDEIEEIKKGELSKLDEMARDTGGASFLGGTRFDDFARAVEQDLALSYELSYTPPRKNPDGRYHAIEVRARRPGVRVRARRGYSDYLDRDRESLLFTSAAASPGAFRDLPFEARVVPFAAGAGKFRLWVQAAVPTPSLLAGEDAGGGSVRFRMRVTVGREDGTGDAAEMSVPLLLGRDLLGRLRNSMFFAFNSASRESKYPAGRYKVVVALYDRNLERMGAVGHVLEIPALDAPGAPRLIGTVLGRFAESASERPVVPFAVSEDDGSLALPGGRFQPMAAAVLVKPGRACVVLQAHAPAGEPAPPPYARLVRDGVEIMELAVDVIARDWNRKTGLWNAAAGLSFGEVPAGEYELVFAIAGPGSAAALEARIPLRVLR